MYAYLPLFQLQEIYNNHLKIMWFWFFYDSNKLDLHKVLFQLDIFLCQELFHMLYTTHNYHLVFFHRKIPNKN